jgi:hypothetical protein
LDAGAVQRLIDRLEHFASGSGDPPSRTTKGSKDINEHQKTAAERHPAAEDKKLKSPSTAAAGKKEGRKEDEGEEEDWTVNQLGIQKELAQWFVLENEANAHSANGNELVARLRRAFGDHGFEAVQSAVSTAVLHQIGADSGASVTTRAHAAVGLLRHLFCSRYLVAHSQAAMLVIAVVGTII